MLPNFLLPEQVVRQNGSGPTIEIGDSAGDVVSLTLGIHRTIEQQSLDLSISGSTDGENWGDKPLAAFPQKFYCGVYSLIVDLSDRPDIRYLRVDWKVSRWGRGEPTPLFGMYVFAEPVRQGVLGAAG
ncbi:hypothetical protein [uncultured Paludibaculum sp.]|uniref:hypothetical protein n=1 Tax=uncultured Paludibaculum sp. TaxID=1765020 RepID=UPI002AAAE4C3|nr:hypothetical protein [uncultured Paludibaculum sp.]